MTGLTPRQVEVVELLATGATNRDIAGKLFMSPHTAKRHVADILVRLGVATRQQAALAWLQASECPNCGTRQ